GRVETPDMPVLDGDEAPRRHRPGAGDQDFDAEIAHPDGEDAGGRGSALFRDRSGEVTHRQVDPGHGLGPGDGPDGALDVGLDGSGCGEAVVAPSPAFPVPAKEPEIAEERPGHDRRDPEDREASPAGRRPASGAEGGRATAEGEGSGASTRLAGEAASADLAAGAGALACRATV